jgi:hypothetical protein
MFLLLALACTPDEATTIEFETPWEDASRTGETVSGAFSAELGSVYPGAGWFKTGIVESHDAVQAAVRAVEGASQRVLKVRILGRAPDGFNTLELDVALPSWKAGEVPIDGNSAIGVLTTADDEVFYLLDGSLDVTLPGGAMGDDIQASFADVPLWVEDE